MEIVLKNVKLNSSETIKIKSNRIVGIIGNNYESILELFNSKKSFYLKKDEDFVKNNVYDELLYYYKKGLNKDEFSIVINVCLKEFKLSQNFLKKEILALSKSEKRLLKYLCIFVYNPDLIVIDEVYLDLDYFYKKRIKYLLKRIVDKTKKTIIIGSIHMDDIYDICNDVLLFKDNKFFYGKTNSVFSNEDLLKEYDVALPEIVKFVNLCHEKKKKIKYTNDIRDLIKEVYKNG